MPALIHILKTANLTLSLKKKTYYRGWRGDVPIVMSDKVYCIRNNDGVGVWIGHNYKCQIPSLNEKGYGAECIKCTNLGE